VEQRPDLLKDDPSRKLMRQIFGAIAEYEKTMIVLKLRGARVRMRATVGRCEGAKPYGELPGEQAIIERMRDLHNTGMGFDRIAAALNAEEIKPRRGARWHGLTVNKILTGKGRKDLRFQRGDTSREGLFTSKCPPVEIAGRQADFARTNTKPRTQSPSGKGR